MPTTFPLHSPDFFIGDPYPAYKELRAHVARRLERRHEVLGVAEVRGHPLRIEQPRTVHLDQGHHDSRPGPAENPVQEGNLIFTDPPRHRQLRKLINTGFTRRQVAVLEPKVREIVYGILADVRPGSTYRVRRRDRGSPPDPDDRGAARCTARRTGSSSVDGPTRVPVTQIPRSRWTRSRPSANCTNTSSNSSPRGARHARDDMLSVLAAAEVDGVKLTDEDLLNFSFLLLVAGNETTRNLIALGTLALIDNPTNAPSSSTTPRSSRRGRGDVALDHARDAHGAHRDRRRRDPRASASRRATPLSCSTARPTATRKSSATMPRSSRSTRHPNPHIAFGCGEHSCIGAQLARLEARVLFEVLLGSYPKLELVGDVDRMRATMVPGVKRMPVRLGTEV